MKVTPSFRPLWVLPPLTVPLKEAADLSHLLELHQTDAQLLQRHPQLCPFVRIQCHQTSFPAYGSYPAGPLVFSHRPFANVEVATSALRPTMLSGLPPGCNALIFHLLNMFTLAQHYSVEPAADSSASHKMDCQLVRMQDAVPALVEAIEKNDQKVKKKVVDLTSEMMTGLKANGRLKFATRGMPAFDNAGGEGGCRPS